MAHRGLLPRGLLIGLALFMAEVLVGIVGFVIAGLSLLDAVFTTVSAVTTVGYTPAHPLSAGSKVFVIGLVLAGVATGLYVLGALTEYLIEGGLQGTLERWRVDRRMEELHDHFIIAGFGRVGQRVATQLELADVPFVVVDNNPVVIAVARERGVLYLEADATHDQDLVGAGIMRARGLLACADSDVRNVYITLSGRSLNPDLYIVARASDQNAERNLYNAGASRVVSPYTMAGNRMAQLAIQPLAADYIDVVIHGQSVGVRIEERAIAHDSPLARRAVGDIRGRELAGLQILAVDHDGELVTHVTDTLVLKPNDRILFAGTAEQIAQFDEVTS
jgi:voltage-gated potassium channel